MKLHCSNCGKPFGYLVDGKFYPVAYHGHKIDGDYWIFEPGKEPRRKK